MTKSTKYGKVMYNFLDLYFFFFPNPSGALLFTQLHTYYYFYSTYCCNYVCTNTILRTATYNYLPTINNLLLPSIAGSNLHQVFYSFKLFGVPSYNVDRAVEGIDPLYKAVLRSALFTEQIF